MEIQHNEHIEEVEVKKEPNTALIVVVLIALIALLVVGILLPIKLVPNAVTMVKDKLSSLFSSDTATLSVDKKDIHSGDTFTLSWNGKHKDNGSYVFSYPCKEGVSFVTSVNQPQEAITCDTQYYFSPNDNQVDLNVTSTANRFIDIPVTLSFLANGTSDIKKLSDTLITVTNPAVADSRTGLGTTTPVVSKTTPVATSTRVVTVTPSPEPETPPAPKPTPAPVTPAPAPKPQVIHQTHQVSNPNGTADLAVQITNVGYLDPVTSTFVSSATVTNKDRAAITFTVKNKGDKNTGLWNFVAKLPTASHPTYTAYNLQNLGPGDYIVFTLGFDQINNVTDNLITITVDPENKVPELTEVNNTSTVHVANTGATGSTSTTQTGSGSTNTGSGTTNTGSGTTGSTQPTVAAAKSDLTVTLVSVGKIDKLSLQFIKTDTVNADDRRRNSV